MESILLDENINNTKNINDMGFHDRMVEMLEVNIVSIVIGALILIIITCWISALKNFYTHVHNQKTKDRYKKTKRKLLSAFIVTLISVFAIIIIYEWWLISYEHEK